MARQHQGTHTRFEDETIEEATESSNLEDPMCDADESAIGQDKALDNSMCEPDESDDVARALELDESVIGSDKTSADYYFDSYSHFGTSRFSPASYLSLSLRSKTGNKNLNLGNMCVLCYLF